MINSVIAICDFAGDVQRHFSDQLRRDGVDVDAEIAKTRAERPTQFGSLDEPWWVCMQWYNIARRKIDKAPRVVAYSAELKAKLPALQKWARDALAKLEADAGAGNDLTPYLSERWNDVSFDDLLLNDWGIHHLHLKPSGSRELLYVAVADGAIAFLDVRDHKAFAHRELVEIIYRNWPEELERRRLNGILPPPPSSEPKDRERQIARHRGVGTFVTIDGKVFGPMGGGYATTGLSIQAVTWADRLIWTAREWQRTLVADAAAVLGELNVKTGKNLSEMRLELVFENRTMCVVERQIPAQFSQYALKF